MIKDCYLITGGNGNLARQLAAELVTEGNQVILFDMVASEPPQGCQALTGDISDTNQLHQLFEIYHPTFIIHMASLLSGSSEKDRRRAWRVNATSSIELLELALAHHVKCFFFPSTAATYGSGLPDPLPENFPQWPENIYGATKVAVERAGAYYHAKHGLNFRSLRLPFVISPHAPPGALTAFASHAFVKAAAGQRVVFPVDPDTRISTIYVKDVIHGLTSFIHAPDPPLTRRVYNVQGYTHTAGSIAAAIKSHLPGFDYAFEPNPEVIRLCRALPATMIDSSARSDWGWNPQYDLGKMTGDFLDDLRSDAR